MKKLLVFLTMVALMTSFAAATTAQDAITGAADRLILLQNTDGGWDWIVTNALSPGGPSADNIAGVTAQELLDAYSLTGTPAYLDGAKKAGNYLIDHLFEGGLVDTSVRVNGFDIVFLYHLGKISGENKYTKAADDLLHNVLEETSYFSQSDGEYNNACGSDGCTAQELFNGIENRRGSANNGIILWDLFRWVEAAQLGEKTSWAIDLGNLMVNRLSSLIGSDSQYFLGLSAVVLATGNSGAVSALLVNQDEDGSWDGWIQDTAYVLMALDKVGETTAVDKAASYLVDNFGYTYDTTPPIYGWGWKELDGKEYSEVTSEAAQALYDSLTTESSEEVEGDLEDFHWSVSVIPSPLHFGTIPRGSDISDLAEDGPVRISTVGSITKDHNVYVTVDVTGEDKSFYDSLLEFWNSGWTKVTALGILIIPEGTTQAYDARLHGDTMTFEAGPKSATIVYTAYGESL